MEEKKSFLKNTDLGVLMIGAWLVGLIWDEPFHIIKFLGYVISYSLAVYVLLYIGTKIECAVRKQDSTWKKAGILALTAFANIALIYLVFFRNGG